MNTCPAHNKPATRVWQRRATEAELAAFRDDPNNPSVQPHETEALVPVYGCDDDGMDPELAARIHNAGCPAPIEPCGCTWDNP